MTKEKQYQCMQPCKECLENGGKSCIITQTRFDYLKNYDLPCPLGDYPKYKEIKKVRK